MWLSRESLGAMVPSSRIEKFAIVAWMPLSGQVGWASRSIFIMASDSVPAKAGGASTFRGIVPLGKRSAQLDGPAIHAGDPSSQFRVYVRGFEDEVGPQRLTAENRLREPESVGDDDDVPDECRKVVTVVRLVREAVSPQVDRRNEVAASGEVECREIPEAGVRCEPVDEQKGCTATLARRPLVKRAVLSFSVAFSVDQPRRQAHPVFDLDPTAPNFHAEILA